jgi:hypothetical protein
LAQYANVITIYGPHIRYKVSHFWREPYLYDFFYVIAMFTKVILGFFQVQGMAELSYRVENQQNSAKKIRYLKLCIGVINISAFVCMVWLAIEFMFVLRVNVATHDPAGFYVFMTKLGYTSGTYYTALTVLLVFFYKKLHSILQSHLQGQYESTSLYQSIQSYFFLMALGYIVRTLFLYG